MFRSIFYSSNLQCSLQIDHLYVSSLPAITRNNVFISFCRNLHIVSTCQINVQIVGEPALSTDPSQVHVRAAQEGAAVPAGVPAKSP